MKTIARLPAPLRAVPCDHYATKAPVYIHPAVSKRGKIPGEERLEKRTGLKAVKVPGSPFKQLVKGAKK